MPQDQQHIKIQSCQRPASPVHSGAKGTRPIEEKCTLSSQILLPNSLTNCVILLKNNCGLPGWLGGFGRVSIFCVPFMEFCGFWCSKTSLGKTVVEHFELYVTFKITVRGLFVQNDADTLMPRSDTSNICNGSSWLPSCCSLKVAVVLQFKECGRAA